MGVDADDACSAACGWWWDALLGVMPVVDGGSERMGQINKTVGGF